jgi:hypothetical protein
MGKCPKCQQNTLVEIPGVGSNILGRSVKCNNPICTYSKTFQNRDGKSLGSLMNKNKKKGNDDK